MVPAVMMATAAPGNLYGATNRLDLGSADDAGATRRRAFGVAGCRRTGQGADLRVGGDRGGKRRREEGKCRTASDHFDELQRLDLFKPVADAST